MPDRRHHQRKRRGREIEIDGGEGGEELKGL